ncbi:Meiotic nuclear division protein 1 [Haplosporangium sp. Z 11]|nr:Meiotic nuclear division protein 1 [Haplosporangium sp. Z 11]
MNSTHEALLGTFHKLQELEKSAPKLKGIVQQSVKDVLQSLVDDGLVTVEKIGTSNFYWSFPSAVQQSKNAKLQTLREELQRLETSNTELETSIQQATGGREDSDQRRELIAKLAEAEALDIELQKELKQYSDSDPTMLAAQKKYSMVAKDAANRWTENIFVFQSYCVDKFNLDRQDATGRRGHHHNPGDLQAIQGPPTQEGPAVIPGRGSKDPRALTRDARHGRNQGRTGTGLQEGMGRQEPRQQVWFLNNARYVHQGSQKGEGGNPAARWPCPPLQARSSRAVELAVGVGSGG